MRIYDNMAEKLKSWYAGVPFKYKAAVAAAMLVAAGIGGARAGYAEGHLQGRKSGIEEGKRKWYEKGAIDAFNFIDRKGSELEKKALESILGPDDEITPKINSAPKPIFRPKAPEPRQYPKPRQSPPKRRFYRPNSYCKPA